PSSLIIPPRCPPMPSAHVLQALREARARYMRTTPPAWRAFLRVYQRAGNPPPAEGGVRDGIPDRSPPGAGCHSGAGVSPRSHEEKAEQSGRRAWTTTQPTPLASLCALGLFSVVNP